MKSSPLAVARLATLLLSLGATCAVPAGARAEDAFKTFKQLDGTVKMPKLNAFAGAPAPKAPVVRDVTLQATLTQGGPIMQTGLNWRVFSPIPGSDGKLPVVASAEGGSANLLLPPGDYFVNVAFGRAGVTKRLQVPANGDVVKQTLVLDAGGFVLNAVAGSDQRIPADKLKFSIYTAEAREDGERGLIMSDVKANTIVRLNAGTYHVVSEYGTVNSVARADIQVEAGKLTEATLQHRAAQITLKLVSQPGGEAVADTAWSVLTSGGDVVSESVRAFTTMVLAEGEYTAIARNKDKIYQRDFTVAPGRNKDVEVLMKEAQQVSGIDAD
ncbi:hypothetical protein SAMN05880590_10758 [Rhizobium sp. RU35A]|uniref:DUF4785 family protein n=1 Tax=Rhizobium straminoryzae TaxID=1387186 RepID=A0A549TGN5_9HYPH|nr:MULTISPECIES: hypothetical protein [Rhizobium]TRL41935.1 hypothetical protein FNA46_03455 [Rhizobium straminoryzae]SIQ76322.1 hypothetical protein SAMN05880590_10758 [Rhizobium sp. RU35A]